MQKGFTLAETLITMAIVGIIMALSIPMVIQSTNDTLPLFKNAYNTVNAIVNELIANVALYPEGELDNTFCNNFFSKLNTIGNVTCTITSAVTPSGTNQDAITSNSMKWYNLHTDFSTANCDTATTGIDITGTPAANTCIKILVDVDGANKGPNATTEQANKDIFTIYVTQSGRVTVETSTTHTYDEEYLLQH